MDGKGCRVRQYAFELGALPHDALVMDLKYRKPQSKPDWNVNPLTAALSDFLHTNMTRLHEAPVEFYTSLFPSIKGQIP